MNPEDRFDECDPTDQPGIYEYYCEVLVDYNTFKSHEDDLLKIQLDNLEYFLPFVGFWSDKNERIILEEYDTKVFEEPINYKIANARLNHRVDLSNKGYIYLRDQFLEKYPQFADIFVGEVE